MFNIKIKYKECIAYQESRLIDKSIIPSLLCYTIYNIVAMIIRYVSGVNQYFMPEYPFIDGTILMSLPKKKLWYISFWNIYEFIP